MNTSAIDPAIYVAGVIALIVVTSAVAARHNRRWPAWAAFSLVTPGLALLILLSLGRLVEQDERPESRTEVAIRLLAFALLILTMATLVGGLIILLTRS